MALGQVDGGRMVRNPRRLVGASTRDGYRPSRTLRSDGGRAARVGQAEPAGHLPDLRNPRPDDHFINGLQWLGYRKFQWGVVGESACADSWGRALKTGEPSLSIPCYAERRYGGVLDEELLMALPPRFLPKAIEGMKRLAANGLRYPIPQYGIQSDAQAGLAFPTDREARVRRASAPCGAIRGNPPGRLAAARSAARRMPAYCIRRS